jgi:CDP-glucose 4,6-dehydratase
VIGGGDWSQDRLVPDIVRALIGKRSLVLRNPSATRPWQHVLEPLVGYCTLAECLYADAQYAQAWNFGPSDDSTATVAELVEWMCDAWSGALPCEVDTTPQPAESEHLTLTATKARHRLGWSSVLSSRETIDWTVEWYKALNSGHSPKTVTMQQIERYLSQC